MTKSKLTRTGLVAMLCALLLSVPAMAQQRTISGKVVDEQGEPLVGAGILSEDGKRGAMTDADGKFTFTALSTDKTLNVSFIGYLSQTVSIEDRELVDVILVPDLSNSLDDVVVIGYGTTKKQDLTGSVTNVKMSDIADAPVMNIDQALQGRIAGVDIMNTTGEPGSATSIRIRGTRSITASNEPLIVVDGVADAVSDFGELNPDDIESVSVLKDASSTAIYGSRGSNGVIIVTTKKGSTDRPTIRAKAEFGVSWIAKHLDLMNAEEFIRYRNDYKYGYGANDDASEGRYDIRNYDKDTDWIDAITRVAPYQSYNVSASGKTTGLNYYASLSFSDERGIVQDSGNQRASGRLNLTKDLAKWLTAEFKMTTSYRKSDKNKATFSGDGYQNGAIYLSPLLGEFDNHNPLIDNGALINTPCASIKYEDYISKNWYHNGSVGFTITPFKGLTIKSQNTVIDQQSHTYHFWPNTLPKRYPEEGADAYKYEKESLNLSSENTITYKNKFAKKHSVEAMAGYSASRESWMTTSVMAKGLLLDELSWNNLNAIGSKENYTVESASSTIVRQSVFGRFNYNYAGRYYFTATARADGSSNFAANHKWGFFPSAAVKWNIKKEPWMKRVRWVNELSLRASAGRTGNDAISAYKSLQAYESTTSGYLFDGVQPVSFYPYRLDNPDLTWEKTDQYNVALEASFFKERLSVTLEGYYTRTSDLLLSVQTVKSTGYSSRFENLGLTTNKGIELTIDTRNIETKNFGWTTTFSISHNSQMVNNIGHEDYVACVNSPGSPSYMIYGYKAGYPLNSLWGFQYGGVVHTVEEYLNNEMEGKYVYRSELSADSALGNPRYIDQDGDRALTEKDLVYLGNADPIVYGGLQNTFNWKDLKLSIFFAYSIGGAIYNYTEMYMGGGTYTNQYRYMLDAWHPVRNPMSDIPRAGTSRWMLPCDMYVYDASYLRLKDLSLQYTFHMGSKFKIFRDLTVGISGNNLWLLSKYSGFDPDVSTESGSSTLRRVDKNSYPTSKRVVATLNIKF